MNSESEQDLTTALLFTPEFKRNIRQLAKKYRRIKSDLEALFIELGQGQTPGDQISGVQYEVYKVRVKNSDNNKGKSGGYRVIYQRTENSEIILVTIYSKSDQSDIATQEIRDIILAHSSASTTETNPSNHSSEEVTDASPSDSADDPVEERN